MVDTKQWAEVVKRLAKRTEEGTERWDTSLFSKDLREDVLGDGIYSATVQGRYLMVYEYQYKSYSDEDHYEWEREVAIEFVDTKGCLQWAWSRTPYNDQLLDAIRYQLAYADQFLKDFLAEE